MNQVSIKKRGQKLTMASQNKKEKRRTAIFLTVEKNLTERIKEQCIIRNDREKS